LTGRIDLQQKAEKLLQAFAGNMERYPAGYSFSMLALQMAIGPVRQIVIAGRRDDERTKAFLAAARQKYCPLDVVSINDPEGKLGELAESVKDKTMLAGKATAYLCENFSCQAPVTDLEAFQQLL
jgi:uncharacterized protein YyaL (SSP411 family)